MRRAYLRTLYWTSSGADHPLTDFRLYLFHCENFPFKSKAVRTSTVRTNPVRNRVSYPNPPSRPPAAAGPAGPAEDVPSDSIHTAANIRTAWDTAMPEHAENVEFGQESSMPTMIAEKRILSLSACREHFSGLSSLRWTYSEQLSRPKFGDQPRTGSM